MTIRTWTRRLFARPPRTICKEQARYLAALLLRPTDTTHMNRASDGSEGLIDAAGI